MCVYIYIYIYIRDTVVAGSGPGRDEERLRRIICYLSMYSNIMYATYNVLVI